MNKTAHIWALLLWLIAAPFGQAQDAPHNMWRFLEPGDPLFLQDRAALYGVGTSDQHGQSVRLYLVPDRAGAVASLHLSGRTVPGPIISTLRVNKRKLFSRHITPDQMLVTGPDEQGRMAISFALSAPDIDLIMAAREWDLQLGGQQHQFALNGSRAAIEIARQRMADDLPATAEGSN